MLVAGSPAADLLAAMLTSQQKPHLALPTSIELLSSGSGHRRELQRTADATTVVVIVVQATAPAAEAAGAAIASLRALTTTDRRRMQPVDSPVVGIWMAARRRLQLQASSTVAEQNVAECAVGMSASCTSTSQVTQVKQSATLTMSRAEVEALAAERYTPRPGLAAAPTLDDMLVAGSPAAALLGSLFTSEQQPHLAFPIAIEVVSTSSGRRLQRVDSSADSIRITMKATAPTAGEAEAAATTLTLFQATGRR